MRCGIEFEYLIVDQAGPTPGRIRDFGNLPFPFIRDILDDKPGRADPSLASGDLGIRSGYWYLEGDERFHPDGQFDRLAVKGVEIRTPPCADPDLAVASLLQIEAQLATRLARHGLALAIVGFHPHRSHYQFDPPLNEFERSQRGADGATVSTVSFGPDINLSGPDWSAAHSLQAARRLNRLAPYLIPFSFSSPFAEGQLWPGLSKRSFERAGMRPAVNLFVAGNDLLELAPVSALVHPARVPGEAGRIEFKAFDAIPSAQLLNACCQLLTGLCLADDEDFNGDEASHLALYQQAALHGFEDAEIHRGAEECLKLAQSQLASEVLQPLQALLEQKRTPSHALREAYLSSGKPYQAGGLASETRLDLSPNGLNPSQSSWTGNIGLTVGCELF